MEAPPYNQRSFKALRSLHPSSELLRVLDEAGERSPEAWRDQLSKLCSNPYTYEDLTELTDRANPAEKSYFRALIRYLMDGYAKIIFSHRGKGDKRLLRLD